jgi:hypothetical protein
MRRNLRQAPAIARRSVLRGLGAGALAAGAGGALGACGSGIKGSGSSSSTGTITIGFITPVTGPLAAFALGDRFILNTVRSTSAYSRGFTIGGKKHTVNVVTADSQSNPNRASQLARQLILNNHVDMLLTTSTPETTNRSLRWPKHWARRAPRRWSRGSRGTRGLAATRPSPPRPSGTARCSFSA